MSTILEKIASDYNRGQELVDNIMKVAAESVQEMDPQDVANAYFSELEETGVDMKDPAVKAELDQMLTPEALFEYGVEKAAEYIANDIDTTNQKIAGGESVQYETAAASKAVEPFLENHGAANFGSAFGQGNGPIGSVVNANTDKNVFGGWGTLIGKNPVNSRAVNATGKVTSLLSATNLKMASDEEIKVIFNDLLKESAADEGLSVDQYVYNLGFEAIVNDIKESRKPEGKVAELLNGETDIHSSNKLDVTYTKEASDNAIAWIEDEAKKANVTPELFVLNIGLNKAAEYLDNVIESAETEPEATPEVEPSFLDAYVAQKEAGIKETAKEVKDKISLNPVKNFRTAKGKLHEYMESRKEKKKEKEASAPSNDILKFAKEKLGVK